MPHIMLFVLSLLIRTTYSNIVQSPAELRDQRRAPGKHEYCEYKLYKAA